MVELVLSSDWVKQEIETRINERVKAMRETRGSGYLSKTGVMMTPDQQRD